MDDLVKDFYAKAYLDALQSGAEKAGPPGTEAAYVRFAPDEQEAWAAQAGLQRLTDDELERAYAQAAGVLLQHKQELEEKHNLTLGHYFEDYIDVASDSAQLSIPLTFSALLESSWADEEAAKLGELGVRARCEAEWGDVDFFLDGPAPLVDFFSTLQCIAPGFLLITRDNLASGKFDTTTARALPTAGWIEDNLDTLVDMCGSAEKYEQLHAAAQDPCLACGAAYASGAGPIANAYDSPDSDSVYGEDWRWEADPDDHSWRTDDYSDNSDDGYYRRNDSEPEPDYTACSAEDCGYCGRCDY
ncbi:hypothetical protein FA95DRAFT_1600722 [Auriscalpium vulgare]|uniref:Uncharacterized protein n=1 Tax=Auriscalpium vulgare TaxID=40419 RepID=A0ACB8SAF6_9AGAM|nr:hypothetical protein FA95DRAFT_1600722 [Auriscalpium vulgare]